MKSITSMIIFIMITVCVGGLLFLFALQIQNSAQNAVQREYISQAQQLSGSFKIESISGNNLYIRNTGTDVVKNIAIFINNEAVEFTGPASLQPSQIGTYELKTAIHGTELSNIRVSSPEWIAETNAGISQCIDTDSEEYPTINYKTKGTVSAGSFVSTDFCSGNHLNEYFCENKNSPVPMLNVTTCNCVDGACI